MVGAVSSKTRDWSFNKIGFDFANWSQFEHENWDYLDAILSQYITQRKLKGGWKNSTAYLINDRTVDLNSGAIYIAQVSHTSPATGTFAADRITNPSRWLLEDPNSAATSEANALLYASQSAASAIAAD